MYEDSRQERDCMEREQTVGRDEMTKTIRQIAEEMGVSRQSVYERIRESGLSLDRLTTERRGNQRFFGEESAAKIKACCQRTTDSENSDRDSDTVQLRAERAKTVELTAQLQSARAKIGELERRLEEERARSDAERERMLAQISDLTQAVKAANVLSATAMQRAERVGLMERIRRMLPGGKKGTEE